MCWLFAQLHCWLVSSQYLSQSASESEIESTCQPVYADQNRLRYILFIQNRNIRCQESFDDCKEEYNPRSVAENIPVGLTYLCCVSCMYMVEPISTLVHIVHTVPTANQLLLFFSFQPPPESSVVPQEYIVSLRAGDSLPLSINVTTVRQVPLDLYILFDLSSSTKDEVEAIRLVADEIRK